MSEFYLDFNEWFDQDAPKLSVSRKAPSDTHLKLKRLREMAWNDPSGNPYPISKAQQGYIYGLTKVWPPDTLTKRQASEIIDLAKPVKDGGKGDKQAAIRLIRGQAPAQPEPQPEPVQQPPGRPVGQPQPRPQPRPQSQPAAGEGNWFLAKAIIDEELPDHNGVMHKIRKGQYVALSKNEDNTWNYATLHKGHIQWFNADYPLDKVQERFQSQRTEVVKDGKKKVVNIKGKLASELAKSVHVEEEKSFTPTEEQQDIADTFADNMDNKKMNHMVINARAGTGKTTTLKQLAKQYSAGQEWLYLVFNRENRLEAAKEFPKSVQVLTANSFGGEVINDNAGVIPHGQKRMVEIGGKGSNARLQILTRGPQKDRYGQWSSSIYEDEVLGSMNMANPVWDLSDDAKKYARRVKRKFNEEVQDVVGKAKGYGIMPSHLKEEGSEHDIESVMQLHLFDSEMDKIKEAIEKDEENRERLNRELSEYFGVDDFLSYDFEDRMIKAAEWLLDRSAPGKHSEIFNQPSYDKKELLEIFAPGGQWDNRVNKAFAAQVNRMKYNPRDPRNNDRIASWDWKLKKAFEAVDRDQVQHSTRDYRDFDDDVWYLTQHADELKWPKYDVVLVDEVQDFNNAQKVMLSHLMQAGARIVAVGDPQQGIYRFRGGDHKAFSDIGQMLQDASENPEAVQKTLTKNWRSKHGIIDHANARSKEAGLQGDLQAGIEHDEHDPAYISDMEHGISKTIGMLAKEYESLGELKKETAFISRNNQPLISAATQLIKNGIPFQVQGINLGKDIKNLIDDVAMVSSLEDEDDFEQFEQSFSDYVENHREELSKADVNVKEEFKEFETNVEAIQNSIDTYKTSNEDNLGTVKNFKDWMAKRLGGGKEGITLTTAHKSKGLEFDRTYDIAPSLYGSSPKLKKAQQKMEAAEREAEVYDRMHPEDERTPEQEQEYRQLAKRARNYRTRYEGDAVQEHHAEYVVGTRGRHEHHLVDDTRDEDEEDGFSPGDQDQRGY